MKGICCLIAVILVAVSGPVSAETTAVRLRSRTFLPDANLSLFSRQAPPTETRYLFAQFRGSDRPTLQAELAESGIELLRPIPDDTWVIAVPPAAWNSTELLERLEWVAEIDPTDKLPARLAQGEFGDWAELPDGRVTLRVRFHDGVDPEDARPELESLGAEVGARMTVFPGWNVTLEPSRLLDIASLEKVVWISESIPVPQLENDGSRASTGAEILQLPPSNLTGFGVTVGVMDGGAVVHDDLSDRLINVDPGTNNSHATHVCGTIGSSGECSEGSGGTDLQWRGMAPSASIYTWNTNDSTLAKMANAVSIYDVDLHNNSWGFGVSSANCSIYGDYDLIVPDLDALVRGSAGKRVQFIYSAGNERDDGDCPLIDGGYGCLNPPKSAKNLLVVGAVNSDDDTMTAFSSWGPTDDGRIKPDVVAPGCEAGGEGYIHSTLPDPIKYGGGGWCGTSMAAPAATGVLAQLLELFDQSSPGMTAEPSFLRAALAATAADLGNPGPDYANGHGRIDAERAAAVIANQTNYVFSIADSSFVEYTFHVPEDGSVRVVLAWDDPDALPMADPALVNDIDLVLISPDQTLYEPWVLDPVQPSLDAVRGPDHLNNIEHITVSDPVAGIWKARVTAFDIPQGPQIVSLVGIDLKAPTTGPTDLATSNAQDSSLDLTWNEDRPFDYHNTVIIRYTGTLEWAGPTQGEVLTASQELAPNEYVVYVGRENHSGFPFVDAGLDSETEYHYRGYIVDRAWNYSPPDSASGTTTGVSSVAAAPSFEFALRSPAPNPARGKTEIAFTLPSAEEVTLTVYDPSGRRIRTLVDESRVPGAHVVVWDGRNDRGRPVAPGVYFYELRTGSHRATKQISWIR